MGVGYISTCLLLCILQNANAKTISGSQFKWTSFDDCQQLVSPNERYLKVEEDPVLLEFSEAGFVGFLNKSIAELHIAEDINGIIKLKILFPLNAPLCVLELGEKDLALTDVQIEVLRQKIRTIKAISNGRQRGEEKNCQGILYIELQKGSFLKMRNVNFGLGK